VTLPSVQGVSSFLHSSIALMAAAEDVTLDQLLEARELLEVPAARLAAQRRADGDLERLRETIPDEPLRLGPDEQFVYNQDFHSFVIDCCGNALLAIAAQQIFAVLQRDLARSKLGARFHRRVNEQHRSISAAIEAADGDAAGGEMHAHLEFMRPYYERAWRRRP